MKRSAPRASVRRLIAGTEFGKCKRCQKPFTPDWNESFGMFEPCCPNCQLLNLMDALDIKPEDLQPKP